MRKTESERSDLGPRQRPIQRAENPMYDGVGDRSSQFWTAPGHMNPDYGLELAPDYDYVDNRSQYASSVDGTRMVHDSDMEDLLRQLPSRKLEDVAETAARALLRKRLVSSSRGTMRLHKDDRLENQILESLQQDLQEDSHLFNGDLDAAVRTMPTTLSRKRTIKQKLSVQQRMQLPRSKLIKYWFSNKWQRAKHRLAKGVKIFDLWQSHLKTIEGRFGTSVVSYFIFLKWVLLMNIPIFLLTFSFLVIPQILYRHYQTDAPSGPNNTESKADFTGIEILTGTGYFTDSEMYYGFYTNETVEAVVGSRYEMKYAYILTSAGYYLFCLIILGYSFLRSYRKYYIEASGSVRQYYFSLLFSGWDYGITSQEAGQLKHLSIYNELKEYLAGMTTVQETPTRKQLAIKWGIRLAVWVVVLGLLCVAGYVTYVVSTELSVLPDLDDTSVSVLRTLIMPLVLSSMQFFIPICFSIMEAYEQFSMPKYELYVHMFREQLLRVAILGVLVYFWLNFTPSQIDCWETFVGQELYRLTIMDLIFGLLYTFFMEFVRKLFSLKWDVIKRAEFAIARHTLELIYTQSLCWLGIFYSPLLPVVIIVKLIITFYVKRYSVTQNCRPSLKPWRASRTHTIFVGYIFVFFLFTCVAICFGIFEIKSSKLCGPYQNYDTSYDVIKHLIAVWQEKSTVFGDFINFITSPGFIVAVLVLLCIILYYSRTIMVSRRKRVEQFKIQLMLEGQDKKFLLNLLNQVKVAGPEGYAPAGPTISRGMQSQGLQARRANQFEKS